MYIRTKDGIHSVEVETLSNGIIRYSLSNYDSLINKEDFEKITIREADTIEELCDGFYIDVDLNVERNFEYAFHHFEHFAKTMKSFRTTSKVMVKRLGGGYGYIRTDKCLLYVAKLNDKGELELI